MATGWDDDNYDPRSSSFDEIYYCYPVSLIEKPELEMGDKIILPPSALHRLAYLQIDYPMLFELRNASAGRVSHCGVQEFTADEGSIYLPDWMMENMQLQEEDLVHVLNASLSKGTYVKLQPHTKDFLDLSNPKAILEKTLRNYSCLTTGDTIMLSYNNRGYYINIVDTKPSSAVSIIETDCEVDFAPPLDYKEPEKPAPSPRPNKTLPQVEDEESDKKGGKFVPFTGCARRLDGKPSLQSVLPAASPLLKQHENSTKNEAVGSTSASSSYQRPGKLVFGSRESDQARNGKLKAAANKSGEEQSQKAAEAKFQPFTGKKYSLNSGC